MRRHYGTLQHSASEYDGVSDSVLLTAQRVGATVVVGTAFARPLGGGASGELTMTVPNCATLCDVNTAFGEELQRRRKLSRLSQEKLAKLSGVSSSQIGNIEIRGSSAGRTTVIDLAAVFEDWDLDKALRLAGHGPMTKDELDILNRVSTARSRLDRVWDDLTARQQRAVVEIVQSIIDPRSHSPALGWATVDNVPHKEPVVEPDSQNNRDGDSPS